MRIALRERIIREVPEVEGRVYEIQVPNKDTAKPYIIVKKGVDASSEEWLGYRRTVDIIIYHKRTTFKEIDNISKKVIQSLDKQLLVEESTQEAFVCLYDSSTGDFIDDEWNAIFRTLTFSILALRPYIVEEFTESDDGVKAIAEWTKQRIQNLTVYENILPAGYNLPCVMWRLEKTTAENLTSLHLKVIKEIRGHILGRNLGEQESIAKSIVEGLRRLPKIQYLDKYFTIEEVDYSGIRDKFRDGQINLRVYSITTTSQEFSPIQRIHIKGGM